MEMQVLPKKFYLQQPPIVSENLVGKFIVIKKDDGSKTLAQICDVEAYGGLEDPGSYYHTQKGTRMSTEPGYLWTKKHRVGFLVNAVVHEEGKAGAVLIRAVRIVKTPIQNSVNIDGPIKWARDLGIAETYDKCDLTDESSPIFIIDLGIKVKVLKTKRVRVSRDDNRLSRFILIQEGEFDETKTDHDKWLFAVKNAVFSFPGLTREEYQILLNSNRETTNRTLNRLLRVGEVRREADTNGVHLVYRWYPKEFVNE